MAIFLLVACVTERLAEDSCSQALFRDVDGDGVGGASIGSGCPVEGAVAVGGDCDDEVPEIGDRMAAFADEDGDGCGGAAVVASCPLAAGLVERGRGL